MLGLDLRLRQLRSVAGVPVAPNVAAELVEFTRGDGRALRGLVIRLGPAQLGGQAQLPDPLPLVSVARSAVRNRLAPLTAADRRPLLIAAVSVVDRISVLLDASGTGAAPILTGAAADALVMGHGRYRFADPRIRAAIVHDADERTLARAHAALAQALRSGGFALEAEWHGALSDPRASPRVGPLLQVASRRSAVGDLAAAYRVGRYVAERSTGSVRARALVLAGRSAIGSGHLVDAEDSLRLVVPGADTALRDEARMLLDVVRALRAGPADHPDARVRAYAQLQQFARVPASVADQAALGSLAVAFRDHLDDADEADAITARLTLSVLPARPRWPWAAKAGALSPMVDAHVRLMQMSFQLQAGDFGGAAATMRSALAMLPLAHVGGGIAGSLVRLLRPFDPSFDESLSTALDEIGPERKVRLAASVPGSGRLSADAARRVSTGRDRIEQPPVGHWSAALSAREREVHDLVVLGLRNQEIAEKLGISERTIEVHLGRLYRKCGVRSRGELLIRAHTVW